MFADRLKQMSDFIAEGREGFQAAQQGLYDEVHAKAPGYGESCFGRQVLGFIDTLEFECVLDVGCGMGYFGSLMLDRGKTFRGVDVSPVVIERAVKRDERLWLMRGCTPGLPFDHLFDLVTAFDVLEHVPEELVQLAIDDVCWHGSQAVVSIAYNGSRVVGKNLHPCRKPEEWWIERLAAAFKEVHKVKAKPRGPGGFFHCVGHREG